MKDKSVFFGKCETISAYYSPDQDYFGLISRFSKDGVSNDIWWPAAGIRSLDGTVADAGYRGVYVFFDHINKKHGLHGMYFTPNKNNTSYTLEKGETSITNSAVSVRCVRAKQ